MKEKEGVVYMFTGEGKGKTSTGMWTAVRAALSGKETAIVHWYKEEGWKTNDQKIGEVLPNLKQYLMGKGFYKLPTDHSAVGEHRIAAGAAFLKAKELVEKVQVLVLDEIICAVKDGLVEEDEVLGLIDNRGETHIILTGRGASELMIEKADLVTEMRKVKHPFDKGVFAVEGLDF
jgi:cob(I)alamin adenosyltransferase